MATAARTHGDEAAPSARARPLRINLARVVLVAATLAWFVEIVMDHATPLVMAVGVVPLAWIALEAVWHLSADEGKQGR